MTASLNVMLLAAGMGSRLLPYTTETPKPAIPFLTTPLAGYSLSLLEKIKIQNLVVNTFHLPEKIEQLFRQLPKNYKNLSFTFEEQGLLGSGGGIHNAKKYLIGQDNFLVMNADELILPHHLGLIEDMISFHQWHKGIATLMVMKNPEVGSKFGGAWTQHQSSVIKMFSKTNPGQELTGWHFIGVMLFSDRIFNYFKPQVEDENILYETLTAAIAKGEQAHIFEAHCEWYETGNPDDFIHAENKILSALESTTDDYWKQFLLQTIRLYGKNDYLIEKNDPQLINKIRNVFTKNHIAID